MSAASRFGQRLASIAHRHIAPEHVEKALDHWAKSINDGVDTGRLTPAAVEAMTDAQHEAAIRKIAADNPKIARQPEKQQLPTVKHRPY